MNYFYLFLRLLVVILSIFLAHYADACDDRLTIAQRQNAIEGIGHAMRDTYVLPKVGESVAQKMVQKQIQG